MTARPPAWTATISVAPGDRELAGWLARSLGPEAARDVPKARVEMRLASRGTLRISIAASDAGAMRAALNTYLGWVHLSLATARAAGGRPARPPASP